MEIKQALKVVVSGRDLPEDEMASVMEQIMTGQATPAQIGGLLVALSIKGESVDEIVGAAQVMRRLATPVSLSDLPLVDTCGTGGDGSGLFNVSTASAFVVAGAGGFVAKHGNRSVTSSTGSADVLEAAGVNLSISAEQVARCVSEVGVGFMFALNHHGAMKHAIGPRRELGLRSIFNVLGPLTNPAGARRQVLGVFSRTLCRPLAEVLARLGSEHVMVVHSSDGLDEITIAGPTYVAELRDGQVTEYELIPEEVGIESESLEGLQVSAAEESLNIIRAVFDSKEGPVARKATKMIAINSGAALYVAGIAASIKEGVAVAQDIIGSGAAHEKLKHLVEFTRCMQN